MTIRGRRLDVCVCAVLVRGWVGRSMLSVVAL